MSRKMIAAAALALLPVLAQAQTTANSKPQTDLSNSRLKSSSSPAPAPAAAASTPAVQIPDEPAPAPHPCKQPVLPKSFDTQAQADTFNADLVAYHDCAEAYINVQKRAADAHVTAANQAAGELNAYVQKVNETLAKKK